MAKESGNTKSSKSGKSRKLTGNELSFCKAYISCGKNPSEAYKLSDYSSDNMNSQTIASKAYKLLQKDHIRAMIEKLDSEVMEDVKKELKADLQWTLEKIQDIIEDGEASNKDKLKGLEMFMKHFGGYKEDNDQKKLFPEGFKINIKK